MQKEYNWFDRLNDSREHKGDIPNKLFKLIVGGLISLWVAAIITYLLLC